MTTIRLAVLDMAGTTVADGGLVVRAFDEAATAVGLPESGPERDDARRYVLDTMGQSKIVVFRALFGSDERARAANDAFERAYEQFVDAGDVSAIPGAEKAILQLRDAGVKVALTTGFSRSTQDRLLAALGWQDLAEIALTPADAGRGRPYPDMILAALLRTGIDDVREIAVVGDTAGDVQSGLRSGASVVAGTRTGAHDETTLRAAGATHILDSIADLPALILS